MKIEIIETRDLDKSALSENERLVRLLNIDGVRHLQMQGKRHEIMRGTWADGALMKCPVGLTLDAVAEAPDCYYLGYGDGCEMWTGAIPHELWA